MQLAGQGMLDLDEDVNVYLSDTFFLTENELLPLEQYVRQQLLPWAFPAGEALAYFNCGTALAGYIVERASGQPLTEYVEEHVFRPLGMEDGTVRQPLPAPSKRVRSNPCRCVEGAFRRARFEYMNEPSGSMSSTAHGMAYGNADGRFCGRRTLFRLGVVIISPVSKERKKVTAG